MFIKTNNVGTEKTNIVKKPVNKLGLTKHTAKQSENWESDVF